MVTCMTTSDELGMLQVDSKAALLRAIAKATEEYNSPRYLRDLAEAHALVTGSITSTSHVEVKSN